MHDDWLLEVVLRHGELLRFRRHDGWEARSFEGGRPQWSVGIVKPAGTDNVQDENDGDDEEDYLSY